MQSTLLDAIHPARASAEQMVREVYARTYGASIDAFPPLMGAILDGNGRPVCAAGLRTAASGFFSECYLDVPVEVGIATSACEPVARSGVLEVTTLASTRTGLSLALVRSVIEHGRRNGMRWGMFTATGPLRRVLTRAGLALHPLGPAVPGRVDDPRCWGSYYDTDPWVCAVADPLRGVEQSEAAAVA